MTYHSPCYWPTWIVIGLLTLIAKLPWRAQYSIAKALAAVLPVLAKRRSRIVDVNLSIAFPEWDEHTRAEKVKEVILNNVLGYFEAANAYHRDVESYRDKTTIIGLEVFLQAQQQGRGVLLIGAHYSHLDLGGALSSLVCDPLAIYRPNDNPLMDKYIVDGRARFMKGIIERNDMRGIVRALKNNEVVWYPPDQDYGKEHSVFAPFFGHTAATITATSRLVRFNKSPVVMLSYRRNGQDDSYELEFSPAPEGFPSGDDETDAALINQALEQGIRKAPTQYMWTHRRFKTQPDGKGKKLYE